MLHLNLDTVLEAELYSFLWKVLSDAQTQKSKSFQL